MNETFEGMPSPRTQKTMRHIMQKISLKSYILKEYSYPEKNIWVSSMDMISVG